MNAKTIALIVTFSALAMALNPAITGVAVPFPLLPTLYFQVWEIPLIVAFMLFGFKVALPADILNAIFLATVFPGPSQPYYATSAIATFGMMLGIFLTSKILNRNKFVNGQPKSKFLGMSVALSALFRVTFMAGAMFSVLYFDPLSVYSVQIPANYITVLILPPQAIFNIIVPLYAVPIAYGIAKIVNKSLVTNSKIISPT